MTIIKELTIKFNDDMEWNIIYNIPTEKEWDNIQDSLKPQLIAVDNGIGYYEYGSMTGTHHEWGVEVKEDGGTLTIKALISNGELLGWTPEEVINEIINNQDYLINSYSWSSDDNKIECELILKCLSAKYSPELKAVIAEIGYELV
jgi:hypothetical protein